MGFNVRRSYEGQMMFVRWECGCIGIRHSDDECYVIKACDTNWDEMPFTFYRRKMTSVTDRPDGTRLVIQKPFIPLDHNEIDYLIEDIQSLMCDAFYFRKVKALLGIKRD
jgi:hypothetical protein